MKTYWDYTDQERANFTEDQVRSLLDVELMEKGVLKPQPPVLQPLTTLDSLGGRVKYYGVSATGKYGSSDDFGVVFETIEQAEAFIALKPMKSDYDYQVGTNHQYTIPMRQPSIQVKEFYSFETINACKSELKKNAAAAEANSKAQSEYNTAVDAADKVTQGVWNDWHAQRNVKSSMERIVATYRDYLKLAGDDRNIALSFLEKAYPAEKIELVREWIEGAVPERQMMAVAAPVEDTCTTSSNS